EIIKNELTLEENYTVVDKFVGFIKTLSLKSASRGIINLTGGEPFSYKNLRPLLAYIFKFKEYISFNFLSNGTMINNNIIALIKEYPPFFVQISIDGDRVAHNRIRGDGAFEKSLDGIRVLKESDIRVVISFTAHKENYKSFPKVVKIAKELKVNRVWSDRLIPEGVGIGLTNQLFSPKETFEYVLMMKKEQIKNSLNPFSQTEVTMNRSLQFVPFLDTPHKCTAGKYLFALLPNGVVLPCRRLPIEIGNIKNLTFEDIYNHNSLVRKLKTSEGDVVGCEKCLFKKSCNGGLKCLSYSVTGSPFTKDPGCWRS
ncbi:radical SAM protein, partial [Sulfurovum sp. bin170]|uniref:radical SAM/SPASM domain-containing protein n=1 Tax=Sulfurovum sp. bin170 TaxID=2695268 RepID=UPI0013DF4A58